MKIQQSDFYIAEDPLNVDLLRLEQRFSEKKLLIVICKFTEATTGEEFLTAAEKRYISHLESKKRQKQFMQSRFVLKNLIAQIIKVPAHEIEFEKSEDGKLSLLDSEIEFNLSHSDEYFALVLAEGHPIGIDLEKIRRPQNLDGISERYFSKTEQEHLKNSKNLEKDFVTLWSAKEAIIKAMGGGVFKNIHEIEINPELGSIVGLSAFFGEMKSWQLSISDIIPNYILSIALKDSI